MSSSASYQLLQGAQLGDFALIFPADVFPDDYFGVLSDKGNGLSGWHGGCKHVIFKVPSNPDKSVILWF